jgi:prophage maintenance system killer protein
MRPVIGSSRWCPRSTSQPPTRQRAAADLFVDVLKVHPFVDGNMRVAVVALATALRRLRQRPVAIYPNDLEFAVGLSYALRSTEDASREPMRNLVAQRLDHR